MRVQETSVNAPCRCGSGRKYKRCCRPLHLDQGASGRSPEALMRSRYCAYALGLVEYILATTHPRCALARRDRLTWAREVADFCRHTRFEALEVRAVELEADGLRGQVSFFATLSRDGRDVSFAERSVFVREPPAPGGRWLYLDGDLLDIGDSP